ncbi:MAG TPA: hypothetical protein DD656_00145 [Alphaproteobacteria bacterium]|nr:hypothetical protein [Alphaproteobacteria bacterium]
MNSVNDGSSIGFFGRLNAEFRDHIAIAGSQFKLAIRFPSRSSAVAATFRRIIFIGRSYLIDHPPDAVSIIPRTDIHIHIAIALNLLILFNFYLGF